MITKIRRLAIGIILATIAALSNIAPVAAITVDAPDSMVIEGVWAYRNLAETGDMAFVFYYDIDYSITTLPVTNADSTMILRLKSGTTEYAHTNPYPYYSGGYQRGAAAIYLTAAEAAALGITWSGATAAYLAGNPLITWNPSAPATVTSVIQWDTSTTSVASKQALGDRIISIALVLKASWGSDLVNAPDGLNYALTVSTTSGSGQDYFLDIFPELRSLAPQIFSSQIESAQYNTVLPALTYAPDLLPKDVTASATALGIPKQTLIIIMVLGGLLFFSFFIVSKAPYIGRYLFLIDGVAVVFFTRWGGLVPLFATVVGMIAILIVAYMLFFQPANT